MLKLAEFARLTGATQRQITHWAAHGIIRGEAQIEGAGRGNRRTYFESEIPLARIAVAGTEAGITVNELRELTRFARESAVNEPCRSYLRGAEDSVVLLYRQPGGGVHLWWDSLTRLGHQASLLGPRRWVVALNIGPIVRNETADPSRGPAASDPNAKGYFADAEYRTDPDPASPAERSRKSDSL